MDQEVLINPYTAVRLFAKAYLAFGDVVLNERRFKVTREAWIASMFLIAIEKQTKLNWWFTPVKVGSPDFNCYSFTKSDKGNFNNKSLIKLEVFEWRKERKEEDFFQAIRNIKLKKIIDPQITIVCYVRRSVIIPPAIEIKNKLSTIDPKVKDIWYVGDVSGDASVWRISQIYPHALAIDVDYDQILQTKETHSFIQPYKGKSDQLEYEPTGKQVLLTPEFELKITE